MKGIYNGYRNLFLKATNTEIISEYIVEAKDWASNLINKAPLSMYGIHKPASISPWASIL